MREYVITDKGKKEFLVCCNKLLQGWELDDNELMLIALNVTLRKYEFFSSQEGVKLYMFLCEYLYLSGINQL